MSLGLGDDYVERVVATRHTGEAIKYADWERQLGKIKIRKTHGKEVDEARQLDVCVRKREGLPGIRLTWSRLLLGSLEFGG